MVQSNHLQLLLKVFSRRGLGYADFGEFLVWLFRQDKWREPKDGPGFLLREMDPEACRHGFRQKHDLSADWPQFGMCSTSGTFDRGKHRKIVSKTARERAREWIRDHAPHAKAPLVSVNEEELEAASSETPNDDEVPAGLPLPPLGDVYGSSFDTGTSSPSGPPVRTGFRIHHLTYLLGVWERNPPAERVYALRNAVMELEKDSVFVLHLCGCGLCLTADTSGGCVEPSHLRTGTKAVNDLQTQYHVVLRQVSSANYRSTRAVIRDDCEGGFGIL